MFAGGSNVIAVVVLLAEFGMFRQALLRGQVRLYAAQSAAVSALAVIVAAARHLPELYVLAALSVVLKVVRCPWCCAGCCAVRRTRSREAAR